MAEARHDRYTVKVAFWLRAFGSMTLEASTDAEAFEKAKASARIAMEFTACPEHIDTDERREGNYLTSDDSVDEAMAANAYTFTAAGRRFG